MITLFHQMIINNWFITVDMYRDITGANWVVLYFISFWVLAVLIIFNTLIAIILEIHSSVTEIVRVKNVRTKAKISLVKKLKSMEDDQIQETIKQCQEELEKRQKERDVETYDLLDSTVKRLSNF